MIKNLCTLLFAFLVAYIWIYGIINTDIFSYSDNINYANAFNCLSDENFVDGNSCYRSKTGSSEPFSYLLFFIGNKIIGSFIWFHLITTTLFFYLIIKFFQQVRTNLLLILLFLSTNYYFLMVGLYLFRFKLALCFLLLALLSKKNKNFFYLGMAPLFHFQIFLFYIAHLVPRIKIVLKIKAKYIAYTLFAFLLTILVLFLANSIVNTIVANIAYKINYYMNGLLWLNFLKTLIFSIASILVFRIFNIQHILSLLILSTISLFLDGGRMNIMIYFYTFVLLAQRPKKQSFLIFNLMLLPYFIYKLHRDGGLLF